MKLVVFFVCACVVGTYASFLPVKSFQADKVAAGAGKVGAGKLQAWDEVRDVKKTAETGQKWANVDGKSSSIDKDFDQKNRKASSDSTAKAQAHKQEASSHDQAKDASNRAASKAGAASNDKSAFDKFAKSSSFDQNQAWAGNDGFRKNNRKHEGISYSFDKKYNRNANENGGFNAGNKLDEHALDDKGFRRSSYDRVAGDHTAQAARGDKQSADRNQVHGEDAWANANARDRFGNKYRQAAGAHANNRDWAEKNDKANTFDGYKSDERARASNTLTDNSNLDRNARRKTAGFGATSSGLYGKGAAAAYPAGFGYRYPSKKVIGDFDLAGKGFNLAKGGADAASVWDSADRHKQQANGALASDDKTKLSNLANQWQANEVKGFNKNRGALLDNNGFDQDASSRAQSAKAANRQWADAGAAKGAQQARHDQDEVARLRDSAHWNRSDRDRKVNEYKKFFNNDKKGGQNWERLKYNKDQTDDIAAADFANKKDAANRWQDARRFDARDQAARTAETARASDAANRVWSQDHTQDAAGAQRKAANARDAANYGVWASSNDRRKHLVDQSRLDDRKNRNTASDRAASRQDFDARGVRGTKNAFGGRAYPGFSGYNYNAYPSVGGYYGQYPAYPYNQGYAGYGRGLGYYGYY